MKKVFAILAATVLFAGIASAQLGINVGYAPQTYKSTYTSGSSSTTSTTNMNGFFAGVNYNINLTGDLNVSVGADVRYNTKSDTTAGSLGTIVGGSVKNNHTQMLVDVPVLFNYGLRLTDALKISVFLGPTFSYALSGNTHTTTTVTLLGNTSTSESDNNWYGDNTNLKKLDLGGTIGVNVQYNDFRLFGGYNMGLLNTTSADNTVRKSSNYFFGIGYCL